MISSFVLNCHMTLAQCYLHAFPHSSFWLYPLFKASSLTKCTAFCLFKTLSSQNLFQPPDKYQGSSPRSVLLLLEVVLSLGHHLCHKQSDHGSIHFSNHRIHILPPCYSKSVTYASIESPSSWFLEKNECLSNKRRSNKAAFDGSKWEKFAETGDL